MVHRMSRRDTRPLPSAPLDVDAVDLGGFGLADEHAPGLTPEHAHAKHQLLYAERGSLELVAEGGRWLLPPQRAAWIGAGVAHAVRFRSPVALRTVYLDPRIPLLPAARVVVFSVTALAREMILQAMEWGPDRPEEAPAEEVFFRALGALSTGWSSDPLPFRLPVASSPELGRALDFVVDRLAEPLTLPQVARHAGVSVRTLARRFQDEARTSFRDYLQRARMMRATELLAEEGARVTDVALAVGFESPAAFSRAFEAFLGESPRDYRARLRAPR